MELQNMTATQLRNWIVKLQLAISNCADEKNKPLYNKWLVEAQNECMERYQRKQKFLQEAKRHGKIKNT